MTVHPMLFPIFSLFSVVKIPTTHRDKELNQMIVIPPQTILEEEPGLWNETRNKRELLTQIGADDSIKHEISGLYLSQVLQLEEEREVRRNRRQKRGNTKAKKGTIKGKLSLSDSEWSSEEDQEEERKGDLVSVPSHYKK